MYLKSSVSDREHCHLVFMLQNLQETSTHSKKSKGQSKEIHCLTSRRRKVQLCPFFKGKPRYKEGKCQNEKQ